MNQSLNVDNNQFYHIIYVIRIYKADYPLTRIHININFKSEDFNVRRRDNVNGDRLLLCVLDFITWEYSALQFITY